MAQIAGNNIIRLSLSRELKYTVVVRVTPKLINLNAWRHQLTYPCRCARQFGHRVIREPKLISQHTREFPEQGGGHKCLDGLLARQLEDTARGPSGES